MPTEQHGEESINDLADYAVQHRQFARFLAIRFYVLDQAIKLPGYSTQFQMIMETFQAREDQRSLRLFKSLFEGLIATWKETRKHATTEEDQRRLIDFATNVYPILKRGLDDLESLVELEQDAESFESKRLDVSRAEEDGCTSSGGPQA